MKKQMYLIVCVLMASILLECAEIKQETKWFLNISVQSIDTEEVKEICYFVKFLENRKVLILTMVAKYNDGHYYLSLDLPNQKGLFGATLRFEKMTIHLESMLELSKNEIEGYGDLFIETNIGIIRYEIKFKLVPFPKKIKELIKADQND